LRAYLPSVGPAAVHRDLASLVRDEHDLFEARDLAVVLQLFPAVVVLGRRAEHLDQDARVHRRRCARIFRIELDAAADDRYVGVGAEPGGGDADAQIRVEDAAGLPAEMDGEQRGDVDGDGRVRGRPAGHGPGLPV
jgi:hypothetical protein